MARPIQSRRPTYLSQDKPIPQIKVDEPVYLSPPRGLDMTSRLSRVEPQYCADILNIMLDDGTLRSRYGTDKLGDVYFGEVMAVMGFTSPTGRGAIIRTTTQHLQKWDGALWQPVNDPLIPIFHGDTTDYFSFTAYGSVIIIANGVDKLYWYNPTSGEHGYIEESFPARHVTSFNGRVVASFTIEGERKPYRIRWSVKNDHLDWNGDGSGWEDLFATPGGGIDACHGVFPVSDDTALIVRENSIWQMSVTGNVLAPHRFTTVYTEMGTRARRSIALIPGGIIYLTRENVLAISTSDIKRVGDPVRNAVVDSVTDWDAVVGKYDKKRMEYRLSVGPIVWRYNFRDQGWTKDQYPWDIRDMAVMEVTNFGVPIDSLPVVFAPTIDTLPLTIDELIGAGEQDGFFFVGI